MKRVFLLVIVLSFILPSLSLAQTEEEKILQTVDQFFRAMTNRDTLATRNVLVSEGQFLSIRETTLDIQIKKTPHNDYINSLAEAGPDIYETIEDPLVLIQNRIAIVWAKYKFYKNGERSHGGVDAFSLLKTASGWKIASIIYTIEK